MSEENGGGAATAALPARPEDVMAALQRQPIYDLINPRQLALLQAKSPNLAAEELAQGLELAAMYRLDPFANEVWFTKSKGKNGQPGKLLIMVARDGLRKIVTRNGLLMDGDVVHQNDTFRVRRNPDRTREVFHEYGQLEERGPIVGAWAEVWDDQGRQRGFFFAPKHEYKPTSEDVLKFSPWGSQESVMVLAAAERQAARQATPLSGLLVEGEMDLNEERAAGQQAASAIGDVLSQLQIDDGLRARLAAAVARINELSPNRYGAGTLQMAFQGQTESWIAAEVERLEEERDQLEAVAEVESARAAAEESIVDAEVIPTVEETRERLAFELSELRAEAEQDVAPEEADRIQARVEAIQMDLDALADLGVDA